MEIYPIEKFDGNNGIECREDWDCICDDYRENSWPGKPCHGNSNSFEMFQVQNIIRNYKSKNYR